MKKIKLFCVYSSGVADDIQHKDNNDFCNR